MILNKNIIERSSRSTEQEHASSCLAAINQAVDEQRAGETFSIVSCGDQSGRVGQQKPNTPSKDEQDDLSGPSLVTQKHLVWKGASNGLERTRR